MRRRALSSMLDIKKKRSCELRVGTPRKLLSFLDKKRFTAYF